MMRNGVWALLLLLGASSAWASNDYAAFEPAPGAGAVHYYVTQGVPRPRAALIVLHGHPRDALNTFDAASDAVANAGQTAQTIVVAPQFQVAASAARRCSGPGVPAAQAGELLWTCRSWVEGAPAEGGSAVTSYAVLDALVKHLQQQWPSLERVTIAGFSAGGQMVQHYIGYAADPAAGLRLRYVVASPGSWLYFDPQRPYTTASCSDFNAWRYGIENAPAWLPRNGVQARAHYAAADVRYLVGELDSSQARGTFYGILDKSCAAMSQGEYRLQRAQGFVAYAGHTLAPTRQPALGVVAGCAHDVRCVFPAPAAREALLGGE